MISNPVDLLFTLPAILIALTIHEFSHGLTAHLLGDPTPKNQGRLTLNPIPHLDILGTLLLLVARFGWAKPVQVNPFYFRGDRQRGMLLVALAGPASNLLVALVGGILYNLFDNQFVLIFLSRLITLDVYLAVFNLLPVPPLDGSKILLGILPRRMHESIYALESYGPLLLMLLIVTNTTGKILVPIAWRIINIIGIIGYTITGG